MCAQLSAVARGTWWAPADVQGSVRMLLQTVGSRNLGSAALPSVSFIGPRLICASSWLYVRSPRVSVQFIELSGTSCKAFLRYIPRWVESLKIHSPSLWERAAVCAHRLGSGGTSGSCLRFVSFVSVVPQWTLMCCKIVHRHRVWVREGIRCASTWHFSGCLNDTRRVTWPVAFLGGSLCKHGFPAGLWHVFGETHIGCSESLIVSEIGRWELYFCFCPRPAIGESLNIFK